MVGSINLPPLLPTNIGNNTKDNFNLQILGFQQSCDQN